MRSLAARVRRIERATPKDRPCACGGPWRLSIVLEQDDPMPEPCPRCGTTGKTIWLMPDSGPGVSGEGLAGAVA